MKDGGPAFPYGFTYEPGTDRCGGMSLRDYFAGQALAGMVTITNPDNLDVLTAAAYQCADRMLVERERERTS